jgi:hypothetical protein
VADDRRARVGTRAESGPNGVVRSGANALGQRVPAAAKRVTPVRKSFNWIMAPPPVLLGPAAAWQGRVWFVEECDTAALSGASD